MGLAVPQHDQRADRAPAKDNNYVYKDYIVLLSDGLNTQNRWNTNGSEHRRPSGDAMPEHQGLTRTNPVTVFTIQVNIDNKDPESEVLKNCATPRWRLPR